MESRDWRACLQRHRLAGPPHCRFLRAPAQRRPRTAHPAAHRIATCPMDLWVWTCLPSEVQMPALSCPRCCRDRKSTRLNSSHLGISYAVFCLKKNIDEQVPTLDVRAEHVRVQTGTDPARP